MSKYVETDLLPFYIKIIMKWYRRMMLLIEASIVVAMIVLWGFGACNWITATVLIFMFLLILVPYSLPLLIYNKTSQSTLHFAADQIRVLDKKKNCWRVIDYSSITDIRAEEITGFFYGPERNHVRYKYVCVFLNGLKDVPDVSFGKLFTHKDFIMFGYDDEALKWIQKKVHCSQNVKRDI